MSVARGLAPLTPTWILFQKKTTRKGAGLPKNRFFQRFFGKQSSLQDSCPQQFTL